MLASYTANLGAVQEYHLRNVDAAPWYAPELKLRGGVVPISTAPGLGLAIDEKQLAKAVVI